MTRSSVGTRNSSCSTTGKQINIFAYNEHSSWINTSQRKIYRCPAVMSCHPQHARLVIIKTMRDRKGWQGCGERRTPVHCGWCCKWAQLLWKTARRFLAKYFSQNYHTTNSATRFLVSIHLTFPLFQQQVQCLHFEPILSKTCLFLFLLQVMRNRPPLPELLLEDGIMADIHGGAENTRCDRKPGSGLCIRRTELSTRWDYNSLPPKGAPKWPHRLLLVSAFQVPHLNSSTPKLPKHVGDKPNS